MLVCVFLIIVISIRKVYIILKYLNLLQQIVITVAYRFNLQIKLMTREIKARCLNILFSTDIR